MINLKTVNNKNQLSILMCCHLPLKATLGGAKVYIEAAETYRHFGHQVTLVGIDEVVGVDQPYMDEAWRVLHYPEKLKDFLKKHANQFDVIEFELVYLPFNFRPDTKVIMVARSVLLDLHLAHIKLPAFNNLRAIVGRWLKSRERSRKLQQKIEQSLKTIEYADYVNVPNPDDGQRLMEYKVPKEKIIVQPYGIFSKRLEELKAAFSKEKSDFKFAFIGTFDNRKGAVEFPLIVQTILRKFPQAKFKFLGVLGMFPDEARIRKHLGNVDHVRVEIVPQYTPVELPQLLKDCSAGIFPSYLESFGFGILEMMAMGLPVVGYDAPGSNMLILKELQAKRGNYQEIILLLEKLITDQNFFLQSVKESQKVAGSFIYENQTNNSLLTYMSHDHEK